MTFAFSGASRKLALDRDSFQQLLAAAYTLQQHKDGLRLANPAQDATAVVSEIAALRSKVLAAHRDEKSGQSAAAALVADCLRRLANADGVAVCLIIGGYLKCVACSGTAAKVPAGSVASNSLVPTERLRNMQPFQSSHVHGDMRLDPGLCGRLQIGSLLAFPVGRGNQVAGLIELRWKKANGFSEGDERICQLAAELMCEVLDGEAGEITVPGPVATQKPPLEETPGPVTQATPAIEEQGERDTASIVTLPERVAGTCRVCGKPLIAENNFCGNCGMLSAATDNNLQGKWASMWFMQQAQKAVVTAPVRRERFWPLDGVKAQTINQPTDAGTASLNEGPSFVSNEEIQPTDETGEPLAGAKRNPRSVLSALKSRFKVLSVGR